VPALPVVPNVIRHDLGLTCNSDTQGLVRLHWTYTGGAPTSADCAALASALAGQYSAHCAALMSADSGLNTTTVIDLSSLSGGNAIVNTPVAGTRGAAVLPGATASLINYTIARRYRGGKPRSYFPWGVQGDLATGTQWSAGYITAVNAAYAAFLAGCIGLTSGTTVLAHQCSVSYYAGYTLGPAAPGGFRKKIPTLRGGGPVVDVISAGTLNSKPGSQRRRNLHGR